jgi:hypothetical protein
MNACGFSVSTPKPGHLEANFSSHKVVFQMVEHKITILKVSNYVHPRSGLRQPTPRCTLCMRAVLNVRRLNDH